MAIAVLLSDSKSTVSSSPKTRTEYYRKVSVTRELSFFVELFVHSSKSTLHHNQLDSSACQIRGWRDAESGVGPIDAPFGGVRPTETEGLISINERFYQVARNTYPHTPSSEPIWHEIIPLEQFNN